jgi:hypothetical protein
VRGLVGDGQSYRDYLRILLKKLKELNFFREAIGKFLEEILVEA